MKNKVHRIKLNDGSIALVGEEDYRRLPKGLWNIKRTVDGHRYAQKNHFARGRWTSILLHRFVLGIDSKLFIDHRNGDGLDCRKLNLRFASNSQNQMNRSVAW